MPRTRRRRYSRRKGEKKAEIVALAPKAHIPKSKETDSKVSCASGVCKLVSKSDNPEDCHNKSPPQDEDLLYCVDPLRAFTREWQKSYKKILTASQKQIEVLNCALKERKRNKHNYALEPKCGRLEEIEMDYHKAIVETYKTYKTQGNLTGALVEVYRIKNQPNAMFKMQYDYFLRQMECLENASHLPTQTPAIKMKLQNLISGFDTLLRACRSKENKKDKDKSNAMGFYVKEGELYNWQKLGECVGFMGKLPKHNHYRNRSDKKYNKAQLYEKLNAVLVNVSAKVEDL